MSFSSEFVDTAKPLLEKGCAETLAEEIRRRWRPSELCQLLTHADASVRGLAVVVLGLTGDRPVLGCLCRALHDSDTQVARHAEDAVWSVWFRLGSPASAEAFAQGLACLAEEAWDAAVALLTEAIDADPEFAEAYNQRAIAHYFAGRYNASIKDSRSTLARMPSHFGALCGLGHCYAHRGQLAQAIDAYERALAINPGMPPIRDAVDRLTRRLSKAG